MKKTIRRLRLQPGDILVVNDPETVRRLSELGSINGVNFNVPIVFAPNGIKRLNREYLEKILKQSQ